MAITPTKGSYISFPIPTKKEILPKMTTLTILVLWSFTEIQSCKNDPGEAPEPEFVLLCFAPDSGHAGGNRVLRVSGALWLEASQFLEHLPLRFLSKVQRSLAFVAGFLKPKQEWFNMNFLKGSNSNQVLRHHELANLEPTKRMIFWWFERLDVRRSRCSASHSEVYDALQVLGLGCALKLDVHNRKIWKVWFFGQRPRWLLVEEIPIAKLQVEAIALENPLAIFWRGVQAADSVNSFHS